MMGFEHKFVLLANLTSPRHEQFKSIINHVYYNDIPATSWTCVAQLTQSSQTTTGWRSRISAISPANINRGITASTSDNHIHVVSWACCCLQLRSSNYTSQQDNLNNNNNNKQIFQNAQLVRHWCKAPVEMRQLSYELYKNNFSKCPKLSSKMDGWCSSDDMSVSRRWSRCGECMRTERNSLHSSDNSYSLEERLYT